MRNRAAREQGGEHDALVGARWRAPLLFHSLRERNLCQRCLHVHSHFNGKRYGPHDEIANLRRHSQPRTWSRWAPVFLHTSQDCGISQCRNDGNLPAVWLALHELHANCSLVARSGVSDAFPINSPASPRASGLQTVKTDRSWQTPSVIPGISSSRTGTSVRKS